MFLRKKAVFSNDGELFAFANERGVLKIWETFTNTLKQEYALNAHANLSCSSVLWGPSKNEIDNEGCTMESDILDFKNQYLVLGTEEGNISLYNYDKGKLSYNFPTSHTDAVNDVCWDADSNRLFSCSSDTSIIIWDLVSGKLIMKWVADAEPIYSLCVVDKDNLLSAGTSIFLWNINNQTLITKFSGYFSAVFSMLALSSTNSTLNSYFMTAAVGESKINAWCLKKGSDKTAIASFDVSEEPQSMDVTKNFSKDKPMFLSTVTKSGKLLLFKHVLNGKVKKDLTPQMTLLVVSKPTRDYSEPSRIPVIASKLSKCSESSIIAYGSLENPTFEKVKIIDCPKNLTLARDKPLQQVNSTDGKIPNMELYNKLGDFISANGDVSDLNSSYSTAKKRKQKDPDINLRDSKDNMDEIRTALSGHRIASLSPNKKKQPGKRDKEITPSHTPQEYEDTIPTDLSTLCNNLLQCLATQNRTVLHNVLQVSDDQLIKSSVEKIPHRCLNFILRELYEILHQGQRHAPSSRKWLKAILNFHMSYLITSKDHVEILGTLQEYFDSKRVSETLMTLSALKGLLNIHRIQHGSQLSTDSNFCEQMEM